VTVPFEFPHIPPYYLYLLRMSSIAHDVSSIRLSLTITHHWLIHHFFQIPRWSAFDCVDLVWGSISRGSH
jgi:hypothetical protein